MLAETVSWISCKRPLLDVDNEDVRRLSSKLRKCVHSVPIRQVRLGGLFFRIPHVGGVDHRKSLQAVLGQIRFLCEVRCIKNGERMLWAHGLALHADPS